jgi:hypothetical protein
MEATVQHVDKDGNIETPVIKEKNKAETNKTPTDTAITFPRSQKPASYNQTYRSVYGKEGRSQSIYQCAQTRTGVLVRKQIYRRDFSFKIEEALCSSFCHTLPQVLLFVKLYLTQRVR